MDAVLDIVQRIETTKDTTSAILTDIQSTFDNVNRNILTDTKEQSNVPKSMVSWTYQFIGDRKARMLMDQRKGQVCDISTRFPEGSPISPLLFLIYTTPLYKAIKEWGGNPFGFIDDITITVQGEVHEN